MEAWPADIAGDYVQSMGVKLLRDRLLNEADRADTQLVIVVNGKLAEHYWPGQDPIGRRMKWGGRKTPTPWMTMVGEVDDIKQIASSPSLSPRGNRRWRFGWRWARSAWKSSA